MKCKKLYLLTFSEISFEVCPFLRSGARVGVEQRKGEERGWEDRKEEKLGQDVKEKKNFKQV